LGLSEYFPVSGQLSVWDQRNSCGRTPDAPNVKVSGWLGSGASGLSSWLSLAYPLSGVPLL